MNVLRVIGSMDPSSGGPCQGIRNSVPVLIKDGIHNEVVCFDDPAAVYLGRDTFPIHAIGPGKGPWNYSASLMPWLLEHLARFEIVIVHGLWLYHSYAVKKALDQFKHKQKGKNAPKLFLMPHGMLDPYFQCASGRKFKAIRNWAYWKLIEAKVVNQADGVLFTCEAELELARLPFRPYHPKREVNVGYGIAAPPAFTPAMQTFFQERCPALQGQPYILFLSRIHDKKGVDLLLKAYEVIAKNLSNTETNNYTVGVSASSSKTFKTPALNLPKLVIAGPGLDSPYGAEMQQMVANSKELHDAVFFPGMLTGDAKWGAFYGCEAFILPSHQENFGIAVVEALACRKPVLISNQVNIWREIEAAGGGLVADDTQAGTFTLLEGWHRLSVNEKQVMGYKAKRAYDDHFAIGPNVERLVKALKSF